jgi:hypothetical protein
MPRARKPRRLVDAYTFPGFRPRATVQGLFGDPHARLVTLVRRGKKRSAAHVARFTEAGTTVRGDGFGICPAVRTGFTWIWKYGESTAVGAAR